MRHPLHPFLAPLLGLVLGAAMLAPLPGCGEAEVTNLTDYSGDTLVAPATPKVAPPVQTLPDPPITPAILAKVRPCDGFDYPVGPPHAKNYYKFRGFLPKDLEHLGEDWNGTGGGNSDFGDFVHAAADGVVFISQDYGAGWGLVVRVLHNYGTKEAPQYIESVYAHVQSSWVTPGFRLKRGDILGTIGTAKNKYHAHLHFEMRKAVGKDIGCGYDGDTLGFVDPTVFILAHRPE
jgi:Peptidase family M23